MDITLVISVIVLAVITAAEMICLFCCANLRAKVRPVAAVVPVCRGCSDIGGLLEYYGKLLERDSPSLDAVFFINYGADELQLKACRSFCRTFPRARLIGHEELEKNLSEIFAFSAEK